MNTNGNFSFQFIWQSSQYTLFIQSTALSPCVRKPSNHLNTKLKFSFNSENIDKSITLKEGNHSDNGNTFIWKSSREYFFFLNQQNMNLDLHFISIVRFCALQKKRGKIQKNIFRKVFFFIYFVGT